jgi:nicotinate-nucleotide pyrophosphorylase (carboxylating)
MDAVTLKLQAEPLILMALREDMPNEDISTVLVTDGHEVGEVRLVAQR